MRFNAARNEAFGCGNFIDLSQAIEIPQTMITDIYKCRVLYTSEIETIDFQPYTPKLLRTLKLVEGGDIDYHLKYEDRSALSVLLEQKGEADDILIVKNGCITDTSYSNIAFSDGKEWFTPDTYLLNGTQRQYMLAQGLLKACRITPADLHKYSAAKPINAMLKFEQTPEVKILF
jgi:4-amino-4-deoxychorismate lyase